MTTPTVREGWREGSMPTRRCLICSQPVASRRGRYCSRACQQRAYRLRQGSTTLDDQAVRRELQRRRRTTEHTIYECPSCAEQYLGERRCPDCNRFCRAVGLGGRCPDCDAVIALTDFIPLEVPR